MRKRLADDLHLQGMAKRTVNGYVRAVRQLADYSRCSPENIDDDQIRKLAMSKTDLLSVHIAGGK